MLGLGKEMREIGNEVEEVEREEKALSQKSADHREVCLSRSPSPLSHRDLSPLNSAQDDGLFCHHIQDTPLTRYIPPPT